MTMPADPAVEERDAELPREPLPGLPAAVLALVDRGAPDDGISYVGLLLERALSELAPRLKTITVFPDVEGGGDATLIQRGVFSAKLATAARKAGFVLYNHAGVATAQSAIPARLRRPYAVFVHGREAWGEDADAARQKALCDAALCIANSTYTANRVADAHPGLVMPTVCPLTLLPDGDRGSVDGALVSSVTARTVIMAGRMNSAERDRGHDELLEAWPTVLARRTDAKLLIVGRGDDEKRLQAKATALGLAASVRFTGLVAESTLDGMLERSAGYVLPSHDEGFGLGHLRAMRAAVPCIGGAEDGAREVIEDGVTGMLVPSADREALAQALINLLGDTVRRRTMGEAGRKRYEAMFGFDHFRARLGEILVERFRSTPA